MSVTENMKHLASIVTPTSPSIELTVRLADIDALKKELR